MLGDDTVTPKAITDRQVLIAVRDRGYGETVIDKLMKETGQTRENCYKAIDLVVDRGLIYSGVSARYPWLTERGHQALTKHRRDDDVSQKASADI